ncbi:MAG: ABC transporter permease subunit [Actinomycetota bacterium]|nr:ABC transporter permease subunit [Actinomycetota bacterium]
MSGQGNVAVVPPEAGKRGLVSRYGMTAAFLAPAALLLGVWIVYPAIYTLFRSFFDRSGENFVGFDNYAALFTDEGLVQAITNNAIWVLVVPALVTAIGLIFAVLTERVSWAVAFKTAVFMPMAISAFAAGVIWRITLEQDPNRGPVNATLAAVKETFDPAGVLPRARPSTPQLKGSLQQGYTLARPLAPGDTALMGLTAIPLKDLPEQAKPAAAPEQVSDGISGVVWRDFKPGGGTPGKVESGETGIPGVTVELRDPGGEVISTAESGADGSFRFQGVQGQDLRVAIGASTFAQPFAGVGWLGEKLIVPSLLMAYIWIWAGFAMVVIAAGLSAIPRDVMEAARTDGATEWQVFRRVTVPLLAPVLSVVFITMVINVLKVFDIVLSLAPGSVQDDATVIALSMWRTSFGGINDFGLGSAIAVFLFLLVIPVILLNIRRFRREEA